MKRNLRGFLNHLAVRTGADISTRFPRSGFGDGDIIEQFFPGEVPANRYSFFLPIYEAVSALPKPGRSWELWVKWGHDDTGNRPPLPAGTYRYDSDHDPDGRGVFVPYTYSERTSALDTVELNDSWRLHVYRNRVEIAAKGGGSGGSGNIVIWYAPPNPTLGYHFTGDEAGSPASYGGDPR
jgi:hypothetical protein